MANLNAGRTTNSLGGSAGGGAYQGMGVGNNAMPFREVTRRGSFPNDNTGPGRSQGEVPGAGSIYAATLNERPNISNPRNRGPERPPSRSASTPVPIVGQDSRATGRL